MIFDDRPESSAETRETSQLWLRWIWVACAAVCVLGAVVWFARRQMARQTEGPTTVVRASTEDEPNGTGHFELAEDRLKNMDGIDVDAAADRIVFHLQKWVDAQGADSDWIADPLFNGLPKRLGYAGKQNMLSRLTFDNQDVYALREAFWQRDVARRVAQHGMLDQQLEHWLASSESRHDAETMRQLRVVCRLFDWVNRNIQLEGNALAEATANLKQPFPNGAGRTSWEGMLVGRGHAWVRAQVLILLARQQHVDIVVLGIQQEAEEPRPWLTAAFVGGKLFLFDTRLGLPVPANDDGAGVATLNQVIETPTLIRQLDADGDRYPIQAADLESVVAMVHATPAYLSQRMKLIEPRLTGDFKTVLTTEPSRLRQILTKLNGVGRVTLWTLPYDALRYVTMLKKNPDARFQRESNLWVFEGDRPLAMGRRRYFEGILDDAPPKMGCKSYYLECRISDKQVPSVAAERVVELLEQADMDIEKQPVDQLRAMQQDVFNRLMQSKRAATYWLGLLNLEEQKYQVAVDYLEKRVLPVDKGSFLQGARYNLGVTYERLAAEGRDGALEKAIESYLSEERTSPQYPGNWLRAERIKRQLHKAGK